MDYRPVVTRHAPNACFEHLHYTYEDPKSGAMLGKVEWLEKQKVWKATRVERSGPLVHFDSKTFEVLSKAGKWTCGIVSDS